jgi:Ribosome biogenesis protein Nop16
MRRPRSRSTKKVSRRQKHKLDISFASVPLVATLWNKNLTLKQNYKNLGLLEAINPKAGGTGILLLYRYS